MSTAGTRRMPSGHWLPAFGRSVLQTARGAVVCGLAGAVLCSVLSGCAVVGPNYKRPAVELPKAWRTDLADSPDVANSAWWELFGDRHLDTLIKKAIDNNSDLLIASHRVDQYESRLEVHQAEAYPQVGYAGGFQRTQRSQEIPELLQTGKNPSYNTVNADLTFNWEPDVWGKIKRSNEAARAELLYAEENRRAVMLKVVTSVASAYVQLLSLDEQLRFVRQILDNRREWMKVLDDKYKGGMATLLSVEKARADVAEVEAMIPDIERQVSEAENSLSNLVGDNPGPIPRGTIRALKLPPVPRSVPADVLVQRPDVLAAEQDLVSANARIGVAQAEYYPTFSLNGSLGLGADDIHWLLAKTAREGQISRALLGPIFTAGRIAGEVSQAEAVQREKAEAYLQSVQTALQEIDNALVSRVKTETIVQAQARQVKALQEVARLSRLRFEGGQSDMQSVLDAERQLYSGQEQQNQGLRQEFTALVSVYKALGGGWMVAQDKLRGRVEPSDPKPEPPPEPKPPYPKSFEAPT